MKTLKVGLLVDSTLCDKYVRELALWAKVQANIRLSHLIVHSRQQESKLDRFKNILLKQGLYTLLSNILFRLIISAENLLLKRSDLHKDHYQTFDLSKLVDGILTISPIISRSGFAYRFSTEDIEKIKALDFDLLIRCGSGILRGDILHASRLGVISFHHGDKRIYRGAPAGFWECYYEWPQTGFVIQRLTEKPDAGGVLVRGLFRTRYYYSFNQAQIYKKSLAHLKSLLKKVASLGELPSIDRAPAPYSDILLRSPTLTQYIVYGCKLLKRVSIKAIAKIVMLRERFGISILSSGKWDEAALRQSTKASFHRGRYWADPFLYTHDGKTFCFVEDYVYKRKKGHITVLEVIGTKVVEIGTALYEPFHLSFPFLFTYKGKLFMCPESFESGQIRVYRCTEFPLKWVLESVVMEGVSAADTMLFEKEGKWWLLTSIDESGTGDHCSELYLFSGDSPLSTRWTAHQQNPIRIDSCGGRNAGLIFNGDRLFRLAQCQGFDRYGHSLLVYEVREVSESRYVEDLVARINPNFRKRLLGTHHLSTDGKTTVIDHVSYSFVF
jgi:hypothetical protein